MQSTSLKEITVTALGQSGFLLEFPGNFSFAFDPYDLQEPRPVDVVFITHKHGDHCDPKSIEKMVKDGTMIVAPKSCEECLEQFGEKVQWLTDEPKQRLGLIEFQTIPAYNLNKFRPTGEPFHPKELGGVGYVVEVSGCRIFHAGDTDFTPEMASLLDVDLAFLPVSGTYVMTPEEAAEAAEKLNPDLAIPMHFGKVVGSVADAQRFQELLKDKVDVAIIVGE